MVMINHSSVMTRGRGAFGELVFAFTTRKGVGGSRVSCRQGNDEEAEEGGAELHCLPPKEE